MRSRRYATFAWVVLAFTLLVIGWGAFVRASGSGAGCGSHWPLCNGEALPRAPAVATIIEFTHRATSGLSVLLIAALAIGAWRLYPRGHAVRLGAALSALFIVSEALIGAGLVLLEHVARDTSLGRGYWVGGHLVNTFLLIGAVALTASWASAARPPHLAWRGGVGVLLGGALAALLLLGVSGAITALGDTLFPAATLREAKALTFSDTAHVFVRLRIWHPALALAVGAWLVVTALAAVRAEPSTRRLALAMLGLYAVQLALGAANVWLLAPIGVQLAHLLLSDLIWIALVLLTAQVLTAPTAAVASVAASSPLPGWQTAPPR